MVVSFVSMCSPFNGFSLNVVLVAFVGILPSVQS